MNPTEPKHTTLSRRQIRTLMRWAFMAGHKATGDQKALEWQSHELTRNLLAGLEKTK